MRPLRFLRHLARLLDDPEAPRLVEVGFESVLFARSAAASHVWGELRGVLTLTLERARIPYRAVPVATAKRHATGSGSADKAAVARAVLERFSPLCPGLVRRTLSEDETDALSVLACVLDGAEPLSRAARPRVRPRPRAAARAGRAAAAHR